MWTLLAACATLGSRGVSVHADSFEVRTTTVATGLRLSSASLRLECTASSGNWLEPTNHHEELRVPLTVETRREDGVDVHRVSFAAAELRDPWSPFEFRDHRCFSALSLGWTDTAGTRNGQFHTEADGGFAGDTTDALLAPVRGATFEHPTHAPDPSKCGWSEYRTLAGVRTLVPLQGQMPRDPEEAYCDDPALRRCGPEEWNIDGGHCCPAGQRWTTEQGCHWETGALGEPCASLPDGGSGSCPWGPLDVGEDQPDTSSPAVGTLRYVPPGTYWDVHHRLSDRQQEKHLIAQGLYVMESEVTQGMWSRLMGENPAAHTTCGADCPVEGVTWKDASAFAARLAEREGGTWRLLSREEWMWAAMGGQALPYAGSADADAVAWHRGNAREPHPVCTRARNGFGLCDMSGNVWEWVSDQAGAFEGFHLLLGGSWFSLPWHARVFREARRDDTLPVDDVGFRVAREL